MVNYVIAAVLAAAGIALAVLAYRKHQVRAMLKSTPTVPANALREGEVVVVRGKVQCDQPLTAPDLGSPCVYYAYDVQKRERQESSDGNAKYNWRSIDQGSSRTRFRLTDASGSVVVDPDHAQIDAPVVVDRPIQPNEGLNVSNQALRAAMSVASSLMGGDDQRKIKVQALLVDHELSVLGTVTRASDGSLQLAKGASHFYISTKSEDQVIRSLGWAVLGFGLLSLVLFAGGVVVAMLKVKGSH